MRCPECSGLLKKKGKDFICQECGMVWKPHELDDYYDEGEDVTESERDRYFREYKEWYFSSKK